MVEIQREQVDLKEAARQVADEFRPGGQARTAPRCRSGGEARSVALADLNRVSQIIRILIDNALTHTPQGTNVTVTAVRGRNAAELIVGDDAKKGIDPRAIDKVFDRFYTGDAATGSGLGLAIADELALRMDGSWRSSPAAGTRPSPSACPLASGAGASASRPGPPREETDLSRWPSPWRRR